MKIPKTKALGLVNEKISQFQKILVEATYDSQFNETYKLVYGGAEALLTELFSKEEADKFCVKVISLAGLFDEEDDAQELQRYKGHINACIAELKVYRETIQNFWSDELANEKKENIVPFVAMSFDDSDREINEYITGLLEALRIEFRTGEQYSKDSIPEKVQSRIRGSDLFVAIFVTRDKIEGGGYTTPSWLLKELGIAQGAGKDVIALVERGIKDIAGLDYEKEVIYFERDDPTAIEKATIKLLEALKEHGLV